MDPNSHWGFDAQTESLADRDRYGSGAAHGRAGSALGGDADKTDQLRAQLHDGKAKNVIFFLGDGMGTQEITAARYYQYGAAGRMNVDRLPFTGFDDHVVGQARRGAALPARLRPRLGLHGHDVGDRAEDDRRAHLAGSEQRHRRPGKNLQTVLERAQKAGMKRRNVSTAEITDATPAVLDSHISLRGCQGPEDMAACPKETKAAGGLGSIAEQTVDHKRRRRARRGARPLQRRRSPAAGRRQDRRATGAAPGLHLRQHARRPGRGHRRDKPVLGLFNTRQHDDRVDRPGRHARRRAAGAERATRTAPGQRAEPGRMTTQGDRAAGPARKARASSCRSRAPRSTSRTTPPTRARQIGETVAFDDAIGVALDYQRCTRTR